MRRLVTLLALLLSGGASLAGQAGRWGVAVPATFGGQPSQVTATLTLTPAGTFEALLVNAPAEGPAFYLWSGGRWWTAAPDQLCVQREAAPPRCLPYRLTADTLTWGPIAFTARPRADSLEVPR